MNLKVVGFSKSLDNMPQSGGELPLATINTTMH
jgi:hypothetical protein